MTPLVTGLVLFPFQLRPDCCVRLYLPARLTARDVARLTAMLQTLVVPEPEDDEATA